MPEAQPQAPAAPIAPPPAAPAAEAPAPAASDLEVAQNNGEQAPPAKSDGEAPKETPEQAAKRQGRRFERKLDKAYRERAEAQAAADLYRRQLEEARAKGATPEDPGAPKLEQFKDIEEYAAAKAKYAEDKAVRAVQEKQRAEQQKHQQARLTEAWESKAEAGSEKYDDWADKVGELKPTSPFAVAIMHSENGHDVAYHLGGNEKEAMRIMALSPVEQILEIGRLSAKLALEPAKPKVPSQAPAPIKPLKGDAPVVTDVPSDQDNMRDWMRKRTKQVHGKR
jgi:hypothetical protein